MKRVFVRRLGHPELLPLWLLTPAAIVMCVILIWPIAQGILLGFFNTRILNYDAGRYIGLANYEVLLSDPSFWNSLKVTVYYGIASMSCTYVLGLSSALLLNRSLPFRGMIRTIFILPWAVPEVVAVLIFIWMLDAQYGVINYFFVEAGFLDAPVAWLARADLAMPALVLITSWHQFPLALLILLAGLQTIPQEEYEAAMVDGAGAFSRFIHVTLPGLRAVNVILILILILNSFRRGDHDICDDGRRSGPCD